VKISTIVTGSLARTELEGASMPPKPPEEIGMPVLIVAIDGIDEAGFREVAERENWEVIALAPAAGALGVAYRAIGLEAPPTHLGRVPITLEPGRAEGDRHREQ
jgi:hypothetical protein